LPDEIVMDLNTLSPLTGLKVLLIDDDASLRGLVCAMLRRMGIVDHTAVETGKEGLARATSEPFDLVICDWQLPDISGIDILKSVRLRRPDLPFLMMSGQNALHSVLQAKEAGASAYLTKPFPFGALEAKLRQLSSRCQYTSHR
jgi:DNA-binding response OmpR family regulator